MYKNIHIYIAHLRQQCHNSKCVIFQERLLKVLKCSNFLWVQRRHNCCPLASFANCVMTLYLLKVHLQMFLSIPITQKCQILSCDTLVANERYVSTEHTSCRAASASQSTHHYYSTLNMGKASSSKSIHKFGMVHLLTAIGLLPGGSTHLHTNTKLHSITHHIQVLSIYKEPTWCNLTVCLLVTAIILYMFRTPLASILRST